MFILLGILGAGCAPLSIHKNAGKALSLIPTLGNIGEEKGTFAKTYTAVSVPEYDAPIKLLAVKLSFTKGTYKKYSEEQKKRSLPFSIGYIDFIPEKPSYIYLTIADKVALMDALNTETNIGARDYLRNNTRSSVTTGISIAFSAEDVLAISGADEIFLTQSSPKNYALQLYTDGKPTKAIGLSKGVVFDFDTAKCCWKEDQRHQPKIIDLTTGKCPKKSYRDAEKTKQKIDYLKL